ncbi:hypothetical protein FNV43_RR21004 [Rhamnella rubrinervis]|uniref:RNase H type-1 domain-containing protein n=1 Tax=Rhamnella rubrinervis TaxID=2594499 RepID=A0A8K0E1F3_9ROSA|nr:hypothetical protein FNV43_RR21004 [Rhamnella rubrinervis]
MCLKLDASGVERGFDYVEDFTLLGKTKDKESLKTTSPSSSSIWTPPSSYWLKVNVDAAHTNNGSATALVVKDASGKLLFLSTTLLGCSSPFEAGVEALNWACVHVEDCEWKHVFWKVHAKEVVKVFTRRRNQPAGLPFTG